MTIKDIIRRRAYTQTCPCCNEQTTFDPRYIFTVVDDPVVCPYCGEKYPDPKEA